MSNELYHFGVKGMKWGVRRNRNSLSKEDKRYDKLAKKDAKEYARAKMFYGEGAGTRRKLIKNTVAQRRKENAHYNKAFDMYLSEQDMAKHVGAAKRERKAKNAANFGHRVAKKAFNAATSTPYILMSDVNDSYLGGEQMNNELYHFGVKGMHWGVRRYEDKNGRLTNAGKKRYNTDSNSFSGKYKKRAKLISDASERASRYAKYANESARNFQKNGDKNSMRIAQNQAKRYTSLSQKYRSLDPRKLDRQTIKELKKFNKGFFTDADYSYYEFNGHEYSTEDPSYKRRVQHMYPYGDNELYHFGVKGMKWGLRRYQNQDGSYTAQGRGRYAPNGSSRSSGRSTSGSRSRGASTDRRARLKRAAKIGAGVAAAGLAAYGGYRLAKSGS